MIENDAQKLEPGALVELFELDASNISGDILRFHGYTQVGNIIWQGNEYYPWAIEATGFGKTGVGQQPSPTLRVGNIGQDGNGDSIVGIITALCLITDDLVGARMTRFRTLAQYLDDSPTADPNEQFPPEIWIVEEKVSETRTIVEFRLSSALDFENQQLPGNKIIANHCLALKKGGYRGYWCNYTGPNMFDINDNPVTDPALDKCAGMVQSCKKRFGEFEVINFVGAPSADRVRGYV